MTTTPRVQRLDDRLVSQIAAGEVVERPASVVKELVENALDAGAGEISVRLDAGGIGGVLVADDGVGMGREDAELAVERHATSKIRSFEDLLDVVTMGFRGEALAAIAAVSRFELRTATTPGNGWRVGVEGGRRMVSEPVAHPVGTTIEVADLFWNVPARRKFLKIPAAEGRRGTEVVQGLALARCDVAFRLDQDGRRVIDAEAHPGDLRARIAALFGTTLAAGLVEIPNRGLRDEVVGGLVGGPETAGGRRAFVFVNGRLLRDRTIVGLFTKLARDEWHGDRVPPLFLFVDVPPREVDVNVHPQKAEVRFRDRAVMDAIRRSLRDALIAARGAGRAPLVTLGGMLPPPLAWEGMGAEVRERAASPEPREWDQPRHGQEPQRLAEPSLVRRPVPLSGTTRLDRGVVYLGQYKASLLLLEAPEGLLLVDQHAAHERVMYERLRRALEAREVASQRLLSPELLELGPAERQRLVPLLAGLGQLGFELAELSGGEIALTAVPAVLDREMALEVLLELGAGSSVGDLRERVLAGLAAEQACRSAVRIHRPLAAPQAEALVGDLFRCQDPWACPHGRPTVLKMTDGELERRFGRR